MDADESDRTEASGASEGASAAKVRSKTFLTPDTVSLVADAGNFAFVPGQYVSLELRDGKGSFTRSYSVVSSDGNGFELAIRLVPGGRGSEAVRNLEAGEGLRFYGPIGHFTLRKTDRPKAFVATGTGIAPMIAMLSACGENVRKTVVFGVRHESDLFFTDRLRKYPNTDVVVTVSRPSESWGGPTGRVTDHLDAVPPEAEAYVCGNPEMVESVREALLERGHSAEDVLSEAFVAQSGVSPTGNAQPEAFRRRAVFGGEIRGFVNAVQILLIAAAFAVPFVRAYAPNPNAIQTTLWAVSWYAVVALMCVRPLADLFPKILLFRGLVPLRKGLGILSASVVVTAIGFAMAKSGIGAYLSAYVTAARWNTAAKAAARISEMTGVVLLVTSNSLSQRILGANWKRIQRLSYAYFFSAGWLLYGYGQESAAYGMALVAALWIAAEIKKRLR